MTTQSFSQRVDFTYFIGAGVSIILFNIAIFNYKNTGSPMIFPLVSFFTYVGVIIRGIIDHKSWGRTPNQLKISASVGLASVFVIFFIESVLLLLKCFDIPKEVVNKVMIFGGIGLIIVFIFLYTTWFRKIEYHIEDKSW